MWGRSTRRGSTEGGRGGWLRGSGGRGWAPPPPTPPLRQHHQHRCGPQAQARARARRSPWPTAGFGSPERELQPA